MLKKLTGTMIMYFGMIIVLICSVFGVVTYGIAQRIVEKEIESKLQHQMKETIYEVENYLTAHKKIVHGLSRTIEAIGNNLTKEEYIDLLMNYPLANEETLGSGVWYEPFKYDVNTKYFGPYTYKDNGSVIYTEDYATEEYNYPSWDWYTMAKGITNDVVWTAPYYDDVSAITMITAASPFYDKKNEFQGVVTSDMDLKVLQNIIRNIQVGSTGKAHLIDMEGFYIATDTDTKTMSVRITEDENLSLADKSNVILSQEQGKFEFNIEGDKQYAYFSQISETGWTLILTISQKEAALSLDNLKIGILVTSLFILLLGVLATVIISKYITKPIINLSLIIENFSNYHLVFDKNAQTEKYMKRKDEIGNITRALATMQTNLITLIKDIADTSQQVASSAEELTATSQQSATAADEVALTILEIAKGASDQASDTEKGAENVNELGELIEQDQQYVQVLNHSTHEVTQLKEEGLVILKDLVEKTETSNKSSKELHELIINTNESAEKINSASQMIRNIAKQTNLLALNAAIEAARAGDVGRGFAVVADEIRKLAEQSNTFTEEIVSIIKELTDKTDLAVHTIEVVDKTIVSQSESVALTSDKFKGIDSAIEKMETIIRDINHSGQAMENKKDKIIDVIQSLSALSEENAAATQQASASVEEQTAAMQEIATASDSLAHLAEELQESISKFKY